MQLSTRTLARVSGYGLTPKTGIGESSTTPHHGAKAVVAVISCFGTSQKQGHEKKGSAGCRCGEGLGRVIAGYYHNCEGVIPQSPPPGGSMVAVFRLSQNLDNLKSEV